MKIILTIFAPILTAIIVRIALFILVFIIQLLFVITWVITSAERANIRSIDMTLEGWMDFNIFSWEEAWFYWVLVIIGSFFAECYIWADKK